MLVRAFPPIPPFPRQSHRLFSSHASFPFPRSAFISLTILPIFSVDSFCRQTCPHLTATHRETTRRHTVSQPQPKRAPAGCGSLHPFRHLRTSTPKRNNTIFCGQLKPGRRRSQFLKILSISRTIYFARSPIFYHRTPLSAHEKKSHFAQSRSRPRGTRAFVNHWTDYTSISLEVDASNDSAGHYQNLPFSAALVRGRTTSNHGSFRQENARIRTEGIAAPVPRRFRAHRCRRSRLGRRRRLSCRDGYDCF